MEVIMILMMISTVAFILTINHKIKRNLIVKVKERGFEGIYSSPSYIKYLKAKIKAKIMIGGFNYNLTPNNNKFQKKILMIIAASLIFCLGFLFLF
ncbi:MAG: hypothetical protein ACOCP4_01165 [Candidatus Woesearchaeota archaeon]